MCNGHTATVAMVTLADMTHVQFFAHSLNVTLQKSLKFPAVLRLLNRFRCVAAFNRGSIASRELKHKWDLFQLQPAIYAARLFPGSARVKTGSSHWLRLTSCVQRNCPKRSNHMKDVTLVMSKACMPTLSITAVFHAKLVMDREKSPDVTETVNDIKAVRAQDVGERYAKEEETL